MHGAGNDFVVLDWAQLPVALQSESALGTIAPHLCDRHFGIGSDGVVVIAPPADPAQHALRFLFLNVDGSQAEMCGNGIRCFAHYARLHGLVSTPQFAVQTARGTLVPNVVTLNGDSAHVTVDMGPPILAPATIPFAPQHACDLDTHTDGTVLSATLGYGLPKENTERTVSVTPVSMGNPHAVVRNDKASHSIDPVVDGPVLEVHPAFPAKVNVGFTDVTGPQALSLVVWERGCGLTLACGTGACAAAVAGIQNGWVQSPVTVTLPGGALTIAWSGNPTESVWMTGPSQVVFSGTIEVPWP